MKRRSYLSSRDVLAVVAMALLVVLLVQGVDLLAR